MVIAICQKLTHTDDEVSQDFETLGLLRYATLSEDSTVLQNILPFLVGEFILGIRACPAWLLEAREEASAPERAVVCVDGIEGGLTNESVAAEVLVVFEERGNVLVRLYKETKSASWEAKLFALPPLPRWAAARTGPN